LPPRPRWLALPPASIPCGFSPSAACWASAAGCNRTPPNIRASDRGVTCARDQSRGRPRTRIKAGGRVMSEGVRTPPNRGGFRFKVRGPRDFYGGLALIALAIIAIWTSGDLPGTHGFAFGPGTAPRLFAGLLAAIGALV